MYNLVSIKGTITPPDVAVGRRDPAYDTVAENSVESDYLNPDEPVSLLRSAPI